MDFRVVADRQAAVLRGKGDWIPAAVLARGDEVADKAAPVVRQLLLYALTRIASVEDLPGVVGWRVDGRLIRSRRERVHRLVVCVDV